MNKNPPSDMILCNICNVLGRLNHDMHYTVEIGFYLLWKQLTSAVLKVLDLRYDFDSYNLYWKETPDDEVRVDHDFAEEYSPHRYKKTPWKLENIEISPIEELLNSEEFFEVSTYMYPLFECLGYILLKNEDRWRLMWHDRPDLYPSVIRDLEFFGRD